MYAIVAVRPLGAGPASNQKSALKLVENTLEGKSWVEPWDGFFIVRLNGITEWNELSSSLTAVAKATQNIQFFLSPLLQGQGYQGWLTEENWKEINERAA